MGCCLDKFLSSGSKKTADGKPEIQLLTENVDESLAQQSQSKAEESSGPSKIINQKLVALYDYRSRNTDDLSFKKNDQFVALSDKDDWWFVRDVTSNQEGYIPSNYIALSDSLMCESWYFGNITRKDSERLLLRGESEKGTFLIRESETSKSTFSLSILNEDSAGKLYVKHYRILLNNNGKFFITEGIDFECLRSLISYYKEDAYGLCCQLVQSCSTREIPQTFSLARNVFEIQQDQLEKIEELGTGVVGTVHRGLWNKTAEVAIKTFHAGPIHDKELPKEVQIMRKLHNKRLLKFFGMVISSPTSFVWEYVSSGSLLKHLKEKEHTLEDQIEMASQIASGMSYLESNNFVHGNLCAANVMVDKGPLYKLADYGVFQYCYSDNFSATIVNNFPLKWAAPEVFYGKFSLKSDVWSFGITVTEIVTEGRVPYFPEISENTEVFEKVKSGYRMPKPLQCPEDIYELLLQCWDQEAEVRPTFEYILIFLENYSQKSST